MNLRLFEKASNGALVVDTGGKVVAKAAIVGGNVVGALPGAVGHMLGAFCRAPARAFSLPTMLLRRSDTSAN